MISELKILTIIVQNFTIPPKYKIIFKDLKNVI